MEKYANIEWINAPLYSCAIQIYSELEKNNRHQLNI